MGAYKTHDNIVATFRYIQAIAHSTHRHTHMPSVYSVAAVISRKKESYESASTRNRWGIQLKHIWQRERFGYSVWSIVVHREQSSEHDNRLSHSTNFNEGSKKSRILLSFKVNREDISHNLLDSLFSVFGV